MDTFRYVLAVLALVGLAPALALWFMIHPFAGFWRRFGPTWTYVILSLPNVALMVAIFLARDTLLARDFGTRLPLVALGVACLVPVALIARSRRRHLSFRILSGVPELSADQRPRKLLTEGIYGRVRHPRYIEVMLGLLAYAFVANYLGLYVAVVITLPVLFVIVVLEERELRQRFGAEYEAYARRVPRFIPRR